MAQNGHYFQAVVVSTVRVLPPPSRRQEVLELLQSIKGPTQSHAGCMSCRIYEENGHEHSILLLEEWASATEFCDRVRSDLYRRVLAAIELSCHAPEVTIHHVSETEGLDFVRRLRIRGDSAPVE